MQNTMFLLREGDTQNMRHGGARQYRHFALYINGVLIRWFSDDLADLGYATGKYLDDIVNKQIALFEEALGCKCLRCERKGRTKLIRGVRS